MAACSTGRVVQSIKSSSYRVTALCRIQSSVGSYREPSSAPVAAVNTPRVHHSSGCRCGPHGPLFSVSGRPFKACSYSILRHVRSCIHSSTSKLIGILLEVHISWQTLYDKGVLAYNGASLSDLQHGEYEWQDPKSPDEV